MEHILNAGHHLLRLINEVLDIARIEANRQQFSLEPVRVQNVLEEVLSLVRPLATQRGCEIRELDFECEDYVRADRQKLVQVLLNLLSNAIKYNRPDGKVWLSCDSVPSTEDEAERLRIRVHDTGHGIPPERMDELFVPFSRLGAEGTETEGTGLGLTLSKRLVEAMSGTLSVGSQVGEGSTFSVELPLVTSPLDRLADAGKETATTRTAPPNARRARVLYIEDNLANQSLLESVFAERPGIELLCALQGRIGFELAAQHRPDLILLDVHLPDLRGDEVLRLLREDPRTRDIPVVVVSADATEGQIRRLLEAGAHAYLTKPLDVDQLLETIDNLLAEGGR